MCPIDETRTHHTSCHIVCILQEVQLAILGAALIITLYNALILEPSAFVALEEELVSSPAGVCH